MLFLFTSAGTDAKNDATAHPKLPEEFRKEQTVQPRQWQKDNFSKSPKLWGGLRVGCVWSGMSVNKNTWRNLFTVNRGTETVETMQGYPSPSVFMCITRWILGSAWKPRDETWIWETVLVAKFNINSGRTFNLCVSRFLSHRPLSNYIKSHCKGFSARVQVFSKG